MQNENISIYVVDDSEVVRIGVSVAMQKDPTFTVVGGASDGAAALAEIKTMHPMVVLLDKNLPDIDGFELAKRIREVSPSTKIMMLTVHEDHTSIREAFQSGVDGYCTKGVRMEWLVSGVKTIAAGGKWASPKVVDMLVTLMPSADESRRTVERHKPAAGALSSREQDVLALLVQGYSNVEIGARLYLSPETIKTHVRHIMEKLSVRDRTHAAVEAVRRGLVQAC
jgi:two-component system, NarL family, response regulator LiaR